MTIKPVIATRCSASDAEKKDVHGSHGTHSGQVGVVGEQPQHSQQSAVRSSASHASHRNVVIDGHGQSPQRRGEVYDEIARHRRSPHKNTRTKRRDHHDHHHKRDRTERGVLEKHTNVSGVTNKCSSPHAVVSSVVAAGGNNTCNNSAVVGVGNSGVGSGKSTAENLSALPVVLGCQSPKSQTAATQAAVKLLKGVEETYSGYNSGDEHLQPKEKLITVDEWQQRDEEFAKCMSESGYVLKPVEEDGACLFRAISLQIYGDEEMHDVIRQHTMDYIYKNREYFSHFVTEDINSYIKRKRRKDSHGNHIEIQAMSEIYSRPVEVYCYKPTPINIFNSEQLNNGFAPLRLSYQRGSHYNAIIDPYNATVGVGLGLAGYKPELQTKEAVCLSEQLEIEQTMFEDKLKTTDWEATNEAIEEQIARESYLQWCRENLQKSRSTATAAASTSTSATVTSAEFASDSEASPSKYAVQRSNVSGGNGGGGGGGAINSTITTGTTIGNDASTSTCSSKSLPSTFEQHNFGLSPKSVSALAFNLKKDTTGSSTCDTSLDSDDTDMSSTSSIGNCNSGNSSPTTAALIRKKKSKQLKNIGSLKRSGKKRRRDDNLTAASATAISAFNKDVENLRKSSPKRDIQQKTAELKENRAHTPEVEQQPSTSKQMRSPQKNFKEVQLPVNKQQQQQPVSSLYQELLEASYNTADGECFGQLTESEMLQRAIQMSTNDYIADQKRKYFYGP